MLPQIGVGRLDRAHARAAQFVDEAILQGAIETLPAAARLGRVGADVFDAEAGESAADVRQVLAIDRAPGLGRVEGPAGAIGVQRERHPDGPHDMSEGVHDGREGFRRPQLGVQQPFGRVIEDRDEGLTSVGNEREPRVGAAVEVQQLAKARAGFPPTAMASPGAALGHEARGLQGEFDERVGEGHRVIAPGELVEVPNVEADIVLAIEAQDALHLGARRREVRGALAAAIEQAELGILLIASPPPAQRSWMDRQNVCRLQPRETACQRPHDHLLVRHGPLHRGRGEHHQHPLGC